MQLVLNDKQADSLRRCLTSILHEAQDDYCGNLAVVKINELTLDFDKYQIKVLKQLVNKIENHYIV